MGRFLMSLIGLADGRPSPVDRAYLVRCDVDARNGVGEVIGTDDPDKAMVFDTIIDAMSYYRRESTVVPLRPDGRPNRPLTAFTILIKPVEDAG